MSQLTSPLHSWHQAAGAKLADFGGWDMPIEYPNGYGEAQPGGVIAEHSAVRERVGIFDVSHLGKIEVRGEGSLAFINSMVTNDLTKIADGSAQYNLLCNDEGGVIDDLIVYRRSATDLFLVPNASNCAAVFAELMKSAPASVSLKNAHMDYGVLAIQGPLAKEVMGRLGVVIDFDYMAFTESTLSGHEELGTVIICRTGYTGEYGFELIPAWGSTAAVWDLMLKEVISLNGRVCGLGSRDTLRTEMGYPLHGHELSLEILPVEASAGWAIAFDKGEFKGRAAMLRAKEAGLKRRLRGLKALDRGIPRGGMIAKDESGIEVGVLTSGTFSPTLKVGIGLALLNPAVKIGDKLILDIRGRTSEVEVVAPPFVPSHVR